jgi:4-hydroxy-2-oxoheptanedioate aldolase
VETRQALANLDAIAAVDGIDGLFIGPADLSADLGHLGEPTHPSVRPVIADAVARIHASGKFSGILAPQEAEARHWLSAGCLMVGVGSDLNLLARQSEALASRYKQA